MIVKVENKEASFLMNETSLFNYDVLESLKYIYDLGYVENITFVINEPITILFNKISESYVMELKYKYNLKSIIDEIIDGSLVVKSTSSIMMDFVTKVSEDYTNSVNKMDIKDVLFYLQNYLKVA